jgi:hypothetical protein
MIMIVLDIYSRCVRVMMWATAPVCGQNAASLLALRGPGGTGGNVIMHHVLEKGRRPLKWTYGTHEKFRSGPVMDGNTRFFSDSSILFCATRGLNHLRKVSGANDR